MVGGTCLVFDIETDSMFRRGQDAPRRDFQMEQMQATIVCALELDACAVARGDAPALIVAGARRVVCWRDDNDQPGGPFEPLFAAMDRATATVCYNGVGFDVPVLRKYYSESDGGTRRYLAHRLKLHDPFARVRDAVGDWPKLDTLLRLNGIPCKLACGAGAVKMWEEGRRGELQAYCLYDVEALATLVLFSGGLHGIRAPAEAALHRVGATVVLPASVTSLRGCLAAVSTHTPQSQGGNGGPIDDEAEASANGSATTPPRRVSPTPPEDRAPPPAPTRMHKRSAVR